MKQKSQNSPNPDISKMWSAISLLQKISEILIFLFKFQGIKKAMKKSHTKENHILDFWKWQNQGCDYCYIKNKQVTYA